MKFIKASMLVLAIGGAFALGVWTGPYVTDSVSDRASRNEMATPVVQMDQAPIAEEAPRPTRVTRTVARPEANPFEPVVTPTAPSVQRIAGAVLNEGTDVGMAADGFNDATLFVSTAYAAKNTGIPFMVLKHRMLKEGRTLSEAIRMSKPELDAVVEMERARTKARSVIGQVGS